VAVTLIGIVSSSPKLNNDSLGEIGVILGGFVGGTSTTEGLSVVIALAEATSVCLKGGDAVICTDDDVVVVVEETMRLTFKKKAPL